MEDRRTVISSAELPAFVVDSVVRSGPACRPRVEVLFDPATRLIVGFRVLADRPVA